MEGREIRRRASLEHWGYQSAYDGGPAHIVTQEGVALCQSKISNTAQVEAKNLCKNCSIIAENIFMGRRKPPTPRFSRSHTSVQVEVEPAKHRMHKFVTTPMKKFGNGLPQLPRRK